MNTSEITMGNQCSKETKPQQEELSEESLAYQYMNNCTEQQLIQLCENGTNSQKAEAWKERYVRKFSEFEPTVNYLRLVSKYQIERWESNTTTLSNIKDYARQFICKQDYVINKSFKNLINSHIHAMKIMNFIMGQNNEYGHIDEN